MLLDKIEIYKRSLRIANFRAVRKISVMKMRADEESYKKR